MDLAKNFISGFQKEKPFEKNGVHPAPIYTLLFKRNRLLQKLDWVQSDGWEDYILLYFWIVFHAFLGCRKSSLQIDVILYKGFAKKKWHGEQNAVQWFNQTTERAERDTQTSEQQLNYKKSPVIGERSWKLSIKICADLNRFLFLFQVHNNAYNRLELTRVLL